MIKHPITNYINTKSHKISECPDLGYVWFPAGWNLRQEQRAVRQQHQQAAERQPTRRLRQEEPLH